MRVLISRRIVAFLVALLALLMAGALPVEARRPTSSDVLERASYAFVCPWADPVSYQCDPSDVLPDPTVWEADRGGTPEPTTWCAAGTGVAQCAYPWLGLMLQDPGPGAQLLYRYYPARLSGDPMNPDYHNTARFRATLQAARPPLTTGCISKQATSWRMILDDGWHRLVMVFAVNAFGVPEIWLDDWGRLAEFSWDADYPSTYEIERFSNGDYRFTFTAGDRANPFAVRSVLVPAGALHWTTGVPVVEWGAASEACGTTTWTDVSFEITRATGSVAGRGGVASPAGAYTPDPAASGEARFSLQAKYVGGAPTGRLSFAVPAVELDFGATSVDSMTIRDGWVRMAGRGTVNGSGDYAYDVALLDGDAQGLPDALHIRIWDPNVWTGGVPLYDNQPDQNPWMAPPTAPLTAGSITVR